MPARAKAGACGSPPASSTCTRATTRPDACLQGVNPKMARAGALIPPERSHAPDFHIPLDLKGYPPRRAGTCGCSVEPVGGERRPTEVPVSPLSVIQV